MSNKSFVIISGSPRADEKTTSGFLSEMAEKKLSVEGWKVKRIDARKSLRGDTQQDFEAMRGSDAMLFVFPLYFFCVPGMLMRFMQDYADYISKKPIEGKKRVYAIINCGFPEPDINTEAVRVIGSFSRHIGNEFGFGVCIGGGGMLLGAKDAPFMKPVLTGLDDAFLRMAKGESGDNIFLASKFPRRLYFMGGNMGWKQQVKKNGLKKDDMYRKPYAK